VHAAKFLGWVKTKNGVAARVQSHLLFGKRALGRRDVKHDDGIGVLQPHTKVYHRYRQARYRRNEIQRPSIEEMETCQS